MHLLVRRIAVTLCAAAALALSARAQGFEPREKWPYLYEDFQAGNIFDGKQTMPYDLLNVSVIDGRLHYVQDGIIMESPMYNIQVARVGEDVFVNVGGRLMRLLVETEHGAVVRFVQLDEEELGKSSIGYGKSAVASTQNVSLMSIGGTNSVTKSLISIENEKMSGIRLPLRKQNYIVVGDIAIKAIKSEVLSYPGCDKDVVKAFLKDEKIRWTKPDDLARLAEFLYSHIKR